MRRVRLLLTGAVQGVGLRPALVRHARRWQLSGWVKNLSGAVELEVQGDREALDGFLHHFLTAFPEAARLESLERTDIAPLDRETGFEVLESEIRGGSAPTLGADRVICEACWGEISAPGDRREGYGLNSCAECGPRYAMTRAAPYDRSRTSLNEFPLCGACQGEYADVDDRRFHAEGIACPECGPRVRWVTSDGRPSSEAPLEAATAVLRAGGVIALKGVSGFQLLVDATNDDAVRRLRERKRRPLKPFALLFRDLEQLAAYADLSRAEMDELSAPSGAIVLCRSRVPEPGVLPLCPSVAPLGDAAWARRAAPWIGALLPTSGLHRLLATRVGVPLVCTSANPSDAPLCADLPELLEALPGVCDGVLDHSRRIVRRLDDSVVRVRTDLDRGETLVQVLRRGRGLVPHPIQTRWPKTSAKAPVVLALGGQLKAAVCWLEADRAELSQHLGDLHQLSALRAYEEAIEDLITRRGVPDAIACDAHPDYASSRVASRLAERLERPLLRVGHHRAHVAAVVAERGASGRCLALAWDGLGLGEAGALWGGEAFLFREASELRDTPRVATVRSFGLLGGEAALREPRRVALGLLLQAGLSTAPVDAQFTQHERRNFELIQQRSPSNCSSVGRLFDAVASMLGVCQRNAYEAHAASWLELCARGAAAAHPLRLPWSPPSNGSLWTLDWEPLLRDLVEALERGVDAKELALGFHHSLAEATLSLARLLRADTLILAGGCFQNSLLLELIAQGAATSGLACVSPTSVPAGDGGLAFGQAVLARARLHAASLPDKETDPCA